MTAMKGKVLVIIESEDHKVKETFINKKNSLIYAVCGAGKTELVYQTMAYALEQGLQVGFTIPRRDVVIELEKRIKEAEKLGFKTCIIPESNKKLLKEKYKLDIIGVKDIKEAMQKLGLR